MSCLKIKNTPFIKGFIEMPGDKSISHRAVIMASLASGKSTITGLLKSDDVRSTIDIFRKLGVKIILKKDKAVIQGVGLYGLKAPRTVLDAGNSGTTARLMMGVLAGQKFSSTITGDNSLRRRPMARITGPLRKMGAAISGPKGLDRLPLTIKGGNIHGIIYTLPIPSAQVKSSILLASLFSHKPVTIEEPIPSRDHTEIMFKFFGLPVKKKEKKITVSGVEPFQARSITIPGDISGAAFFIVAGIFLKGSCITIKNVGLNPLRIGLIKTLKKMGAKIKISPHLSLRARRAKQSHLEPLGDIVIDTQSHLKPFHLKERDIPSLIDEIPVLSLLATQVNGTSTIKGAKELRVKETDRIKAIAWNLQRLGADIKELPDGLVIKGKTPLYGTTVKSFGDHRMAMAMAIAGLVSCGETKILDTDCINISFPGFMPVFMSLRGTKQSRKLIITIDGPAGAGKTTTAKLLAKKLGYQYMDTGAMYRAITLKAMDKGLDLKDEQALVKLARVSKIRLKFNPCFSKRIRSQEVTANVHYLARILGVREVMWRLQRKIGEKGGVVAEGRDIGTVVFPAADIKFYLRATSCERAKRRQKDFGQLKRKVTLKDLKREILERDKRDKRRKTAPLKKAKEAVVIDTTTLSIPQVLEKMLHVIGKNFGTVPIF